MRHLFLAPIASAYGEALHGARVARQLVERGDEVVVLAPAAMYDVFDSPGVTFGRIDLALATLDAQIGPLLRRMRCESLVLIDAAAVGKTVRALRLDPNAFVHADVPVAALDCWDLPFEPVTWEYGARSETLPLALQRIARRIVPVPIAPLAAVGGYAALPVVAPAAAVERAAIRAELGLASTDRLVVWPTAIWQYATTHTDPVLASRAAALPAFMLPRLAALGERVHVVHVGPLAWPDAAQAPRYHHLAQLAPARFERLVAAADLVIGFNASASSIATAIAARTPIVLATTGGLVARDPAWPRALYDALAPLAPLLPIEAIRAWPLRLASVLGPLLAAEVFAGAVACVEMLGPELDDTCAALLEDPAAAATARAGQDAYARRVRALPTGADQLRAVLAR